MDITITLTEEQIKDLNQIGANVEYIKRRLQSLEKSLATIETIQTAVDIAKKAETVKCFVYGTLKVGGHYAKKFDDDRLASHEYAIVNGKLFTNPNYPQMVEDEGIVYGELHTYQYAEDVIARMDRIEGYREGREEQNLFNRKEVTVTFADGSPSEQAWAYFYNGPTDGAECLPVTEGIWSKDICDTLWAQSISGNDPVNKDEVRDGTW